MGNISHLLVPAYPTVHLPNKMLRVYPVRNDFTGDVLSGPPIVVTRYRGSSAFSLSPYGGNMEGLQPVVQYSYDNEKITPYSYSVYLDDYGIDGIAEKVRKLWNEKLGKIIVLNPRY